jgi:hypothetical protein
MITPKQVYDLWRDNDLMGFDPPMEGETYQAYYERIGDEALRSDRLFHFALAELCTEDIDLNEAERRSDGSPVPRGTCSRCELSCTAPSRRQAMNRDNVEYTLCKRCDHFVDPDDSPKSGFVHLEDGEQEFDHDPEPSDQTHTLAQWRVLRPDLFVTHLDGAIGPNSTHHSRRGKIERIG